MTCPYCSQENKGDDLFCAKCGRKLERKHSLVIDIGANAVSEKEDGAPSAFSAAADFTYRPEMKKSPAAAPVMENEKTAEMAAAPGFAAAADLTVRPIRKEKEKTDPQQIPAYTEGEDEAPFKMEYRPADPTIAPAMPESSPDAPPVIPVYSGKKKKAERAAPPAEEVPPANIYQPVMPSKPPVAWKKLLSAVLVLALVVGLVFWATQWDIFDGSTQSSRSKSSRDKDDDDDDRDKNSGSQYPQGPGSAFADDGYGDDYHGQGDYGEDDLPYYDCTGCVDGRCSNCMGDGDYAGVDCRNCEDGVCNLCDGYGIIYY